MSVAKRRRYPNTRSSTSRQTIFPALLCDKVVPEDPKKHAIPTFYQESARRYLVKKSGILKGYLQMTSFIPDRVYLIKMAILTPLMNPFAGFRSRWANESSLRSECKPKGENVPGLEWHTYYNFRLPSHARPPACSLYILHIQIPAWNGVFCTSSAVP